MISTMPRLSAVIASFFASIGASSYAHAATPAFYHFRNAMDFGFWSAANDVSSDGTTVVGHILSEHWSGRVDAPEFDGLVWRVGSAPDVIQGPTTYTGVEGVSANGADVVGSTQAFGGSQAFLRKGGGPMQPLGTLVSSRQDSGANAVSADGSVVVGLSATIGGWEAFRWTEATGMTGLGDLPGGNLFSVAYATSADGAVIVGRASTQVGINPNPVNEAFRWTEAGMQGLGDLPGGSYSSAASDVSGDGTIVVGGSASAKGYSAFRWTESTGMVELESLDPSYGSNALAISADGSIIGGQAIAGGEYEAVVWNAQNKIMRVADLLKQIGLDAEPNGYRLKSVTGISADGTTLVGMATQGSATLSGWGWVAVLPRSIYVPEPRGLGVLGFVLAGCILVGRRGPRSAVAAL